MKSNDDVELKRVLAKISRRVLPILILAYVFNYVDRVNLSFAAMGMTSTIGLTPESYGLGAGIFFVGYFFFEIPSNLILRRVGAPIWLFRIALTWGICCMAMALVVGEKSFYLLRFLLGAAEAGFIPGLLYYLTYWYPNRERARVLSTMWACSAIAIVISAPWSGLILMADGWAGLHGWQLIFLIQGLPTVIIGFFMLKYLPRNPAEADWLTPREQRVLNAQLESDADSNVGNVVHDLSGAIRDSRVWMLALWYFFGGFAFFSLVLWLPQLIKQAGSTSNVQASFLTAVPFLCAAITLILNGWHSDRADERRWHLVIPSLVGGIAFVVSASVKEPVVAFVAICFAAAGLFGPVGVFWAIATRFLRGAAAAAGLALINSFGAVAGFIGPYLIGYLRAVTQDFQSALLLLSISAFLACAIAFFLPYRRMLGKPDGGDLSVVVSSNHA